jgi:uncharacterized protein YdeI (YjbR/CyaY-like superfamily)
MTESALRFGNRQDWRAWLEANHGEATEAVVLLAKKAVPNGLHYEDALEEAICFGWIDGKLRSHDANAFLLRFTPRNPKSVWLESNQARVHRLIRAGRMRPAGLATIEAAKANGRWARPLRPSRKPRMPKDLREALEARPRAWAHFRSWGDSYQAACIRWVTGARKEETRARRIRRIVERAIQDKRPGIEGF